MESQKLGLHPTLFKNLQKLILKFYWRGLFVESPAGMYNIENGQPNRSAKDRPHPGGTTYVITVSSVPGKYA